MLHLDFGPRRPDCDGVSRRAFMRVGSLSAGLGLAHVGLAHVGLANVGLANLGLADLLAAQSDAATGWLVKDRAIVLLFLTGGPSQIETFDPKMSAPSNVRSVTGATQTSVPGLTIGGSLPEIAKRIDRFTLVRSFTHGNSNHTKAAEDVMRGGNPTQAGMGAVVARFRGAAHPQTGMPTHCYLDYPEPDPQFDKERRRLLTAAGPATLGAAFRPFRPAGTGPFNRSLNLQIPRRRLDDRRALRSALDRLQRRAERPGGFAGWDRFEQQAFDLIVGRAKEAFDLQREPERLRERYDTSRFNTALRVKQRASSLGHQLLLARRLCEAGCGFVTIHNPGWDMHGGPTQFNMPHGMRRLGRPLDQAVSVFLDDVEARGLSDKILLIITGEFGRTPRLKPDGGRDHWPRLSTLALAGGGLPRGRVIGRSDRQAGEPAATPVTLSHLFGTVLHALFDLGQLRLRQDVPRDLIAAVERIRPLPGLPHA